jgi:GntR family transcriptional repressor for pyruvate dehydrogenase complex
MTAPQSVGRPSSQTSRVADELLRRIESGEYPVGSRLPSERQLATEFELSRPVIREAMRMLTMLQVIDVQVGRGAFVTEAPDVGLLDAEADRDLFDVIDVREIIEGGALRLAHGRATPAARESVADALRRLREAVDRHEETTDLDTRLHETIIEASGSSILREIWHGLQGEIRRSIRVSPTGRFMSAEVLRDHEALAAGVIDGELDEALAAASRLHLDNRVFLSELLDQGDEAEPSR